MQVQEKEEREGEEEKRKKRTWARLVGAGGEERRAKEDSQGRWRMGERRVDKCGRDCGTRGWERG
eukprot:5467022-Pleurochrysis_carterae.AAC.1